MTKYNTIKYDTKSSFVAQFGYEEAEKIMRAAEEHMNGVHDESGSDVFRWAICICIGYECMSKKEYRECHGIITPWEELKIWIKTYANLENHDGQIDYLALFAGAYDEFVNGANNEN